jgi:hypothetical protein
VASIIVAAADHRTAHRIVKQASQCVFGARGGLVLNSKQATDSAMNKLPKAKIRVWNPIFRPINGVIAMKLSRGDCWHPVCFTPSA